MADEEKMTDLAAQFISLAWMIFFGFLAACFWELAQKMGRKWVKHKLGLAIIDFFSCVILAIAFWYMLLWLNGGILRNYIVLGSLLGLFLARRFFHR